MKKVNSINEYIQSFPIEIQTILNELRTLIQKAAPEANEKMSYQIPTFYLNGNLVHFAAFKNHIGFYPTPSGISHFSELLKKYTDYIRFWGGLRYPPKEAEIYRLCSQLL